VDTTKGPARFTAFTSREPGEWITPPGLMLCLTAAMSLAPIAAMLTHDMPRAFDPSLTTAIRDSRGFIPYIAILALALSGIRRTAAGLAILTGVPAAVFGAAAAMLTGLSGDYLLFTVLQLAMLVAAFTELRLWDEKLGHRGAARVVISVGLSLMLFGLATGNLISRNVAEQNRRPHDPRLENASPAPRR